MLRPELAHDLRMTLDIEYYLESLHFRPYAWQSSVLRDRSKRKMIDGARRGGKSTIISTKPSHKARFYNKSVTLILAPTQTQAVEDTRIIRNFMASDPGYPEVKRASDEQIELANKSRIIVVPATETSARGYPDADLIIVDEAAYVEDKIFLDCILPMLNGNPRLELILISSPHGKSINPGRFFFSCWSDAEFSRYEVKAPFVLDPEDPFTLLDAMPEDEYRELRAKQGIKAFYSPRHRDRETQEFLLRTQGAIQYRQTQLAEFVEPEEQVFSYDDLDAAFGRDEIQPLFGNSYGYEATSQPLALEFAGEG
jgi:hypothetical protein